MSAIVQLLGCEWGRRIALPHDLQPCDARATQRIALHGAPGEGPLLVQLCDKHGATVIRETDPHAERPAAPASFTCPKCGMTSYNPNDVRENYCGNCHEFIGDARGDGGGS